MKKVIVPSLILLGAFSRVLMAGLPNIEPIMLVTMVSGIKYGWKNGLVTGFFSMLLSDILIYGTMPYFALWIPFSAMALLSLLTNASYGLMGAVAGVFRRYTKRRELTGLAAGLTVSYDVITTAGFALIMNIPIFQAFVQGIPFMLMHLIGNILIIGICAPYLIKVLSFAETNLKVFSSASSSASLTVKNPKD